jgi:HlyD family secretion protein
MKRTSLSLRRVELAGFAVVGLLALVSVGWAARTELAGAVIASGAVAVKENSKDVQHLEGGIIRSINVVEGQHVKAGAIVVRLDDTQIKAKLGIVENQLIELTAEQARLEAERDNAADIASFKLPGDYANPEAVKRAIEGQKKQLVSIRETLQKKKEQLRERVTQVESNAGGIEAKLAANDKQVALAQAELAILQSLMEKGLTTRNRIFAMERELAQLQGQADDFRANVAALKAQVAETEFKALEIDEQRRAEVTARLSEVRTRLADLHEQRNYELFRLRATEIVAPISGRVHNLRVHTIDGVIGTGATLMTIVPRTKPWCFACRSGRRTSTASILGSPLGCGSAP